ncbi:uncharacterized protein [Euphorbia lathyris]|uniref:uncharacterized protein n=1 Tax=Euphorbia lathyris TaxID=212925 RepID=UPI0033140330
MDPILHGRTKHIRIWYHFLKELLTKGDVHIEYCKTKNQMVDIFTKPLNRQLLEKNVESVGIEWNVKGGTLRNIESARISVPTTLKYDDSKKCYVYRARLVETEQYWKGWYEGLSEKFLSSPVPKLLLLAGTDRLDRTLTIGQMQGKFQMVVVRHTGHAIQEDAPDEFAALVINFICRNRIGPHGVEIPVLRRPVQPQH